MKHCPKIKSLTYANNVSKTLSSKNEVIRTMHKTLSRICKDVRNRIQMILLHKCAIERRDVAISSQFINDIKKSSARKCLPMPDINLQCNHYSDDCWANL